jgi:hypothetical protein
LMSKRFHYLPLVGCRSLPLPFMRSSDACHDINLVSSGFLNIARR